MTIPQARVAVGQLIGLPASYDGSAQQTYDLPDDKKQQLTSGLIQYILNNPGSFTTAQVATAQAESGRVATLSLQDTAITSSQIFTALGDSAYNVIGAPLASIGTGVSDAVSILGKSIPIVLFVGVIAVVVVGILTLKRKGDAL